MAAPNCTSPILSAVLCTRDSAEPLRLTLESLCRQTLGKGAFEVVVVDDGSTDGTREVVRSFEARLPVRCSHQREAGLASARNHGLFLARGAIVLLLDEDVAEPTLLQQHLEKHRRFPEPCFGVLGHARLDPALAADPLMRFVTEVGGLLFPHAHLDPGEQLDFRYFLAGRSSCKRAFLLQHGVFNPAFRSGGEDVELAYRLSSHGFKVVYAPEAASTFARKMGVDDFCARQHREGKANALFDRLHPDPAVERWTEAAEAGPLWRELAPAYDAIVRSARELDRLVRLRQEEGLPVDSLDLALLHRSYFAAFRASKAKGFVDAALELGDGAPAAGRASNGGARAPGR